MFRSRFPRPFREGIRACLPALPGVATFGVISGVAMTGIGMSAWGAVLMSVLVYAGTAQLAAVQLFASGTPLPVILLASLIINLRFALYSLSTAPFFRGASGRERFWASYTLSDNGFAHFIARFSGRVGDPEAVPYLAGTCAAVWSTWQLATLAGAVLGARIPAAWSLEFTISLTFIALGVSVIKDRAMVAAAVASACVAALAHPLPYRSGLILAALAGIAAGVTWERWSR